MTRLTAFKNLNNQIQSPVSKVVSFPICTLSLCHLHIGFPPSVAQQPVYYMQENTRNVALDFGFLSTTFAKPVFTSWNVSGSKLVHAEPPVLVNSSVLVFDKVTREHDGVYTLTNMYCSLNVCNTISWTLTLSVQCKQI